MDLTERKNQFWIRKESDALKTNYFSSDPNWKLNNFKIHTRRTSFKKRSNINNQIYETFTQLLTENDLLTPRLCHNAERFHHWVHWPLIFCNQLTLCLVLNNGRERTVQFPVWELTASITFECTLYYTWISRPALSIMADHGVIYRQSRID